jgi:hypothetical protein
MSPHAPVAGRARKAPRIALASLLAGLALSAVLPAAAGAASWTDAKGVKASWTDSHSPRASWTDSRRPTASWTDRVAHRH